jgi:hypothetical protein
VSTRLSRSFHTRCSRGCTALYDATSRTRQKRARTFPDPWLLSRPSHGKQPGVCGTFQARLSLGTYSCTFASAQLAAGEKCSGPLYRGLGNWAEVFSAHVRPLSARTTLLNLCLLHHLPENLANADLVPICKALRKFTLTNDIAL